MGTRRPRRDSHLCRPWALQRRGRYTAPPPDVTRYKGCEIARIIFASRFLAELLHALITLGHRWQHQEDAVYLHIADKYHRFPRPTVIGSKSPIREGSH